MLRPRPVHVSQCACSLCSILARVLGRQRTDGDNTSAATLLCRAEVGHGDGDHADQSSLASKLQLCLPHLRICVRKCAILRCGDGSDDQTP